MIGILLNNYDEQFIETYRSTDYCQASLDHKQFNFNLRIKELGRKKKNTQGRKRLGGEGWDPATTDLPVILSIEIVRPFFNLKGFPKFLMMELRHSSNHTSLLDAGMMITFLHMFC